MDSSAITLKHGIKGIIFDLDGTLVDSFRDITTALNLTRAEFGHGPLPLEEVKRNVGSGSAHLVKVCVPVPEAQFEAAYQHYLAGYEAHALDETAPLEGVVDVLDHYASLHLAVVTNKLSNLTGRILNGLGLWNRFGIVLGSDALERRKPDPMPLQHVAAHFGLRTQQLVMVGDGLHDVEAGKAAGCLTVGVNSGVATEAELRAAGPDFLIPNMAALRGVLG